MLCAWASNDENGKAKGGEAGNQTGKELKVASWYNFGQTAVFRFKDREKAKQYASTIKKLAENKNIGYDQNQRLTLYNALKKVDFNADKLTTKCECDCSSLVASALNVIGIKVSSSMTTYTLPTYLLKTGEFVKLTANEYLSSSDKLLTGDIINAPCKHVISVVDVIEEKETTNTSKTNSDKTDSAREFTKSLAGTYETTTNVNFRRGASTSKSIISVLKKGTKVVNYGYHTKNWYYVSVNGIVGFIHKNNLKKL